MRYDEADSLIEGVATGAIGKGAVLVVNGERCRVFVIQRVTGEYHAELRVTLRPLAARSRARVLNDRLAADQPEHDRRMGRAARAVARLRALARGER